MPQAPAAEPGSPALPKHVVWRALRTLESVGGIALDSILEPSGQGGWTVRFVVPKDRPSRWQPQPNTTLHAVLGDSSRWVEHRSPAWAGTAFREGLPSWEELVQLVDEGGALTLRLQGYQSESPRLWEQAVRPRLERWARAASLVIGKPRVLGHPDRFHRFEIDVTPLTNCAPCWLARIEDATRLVADLIELDGGTLASVAMTIGQNGQCSGGWGFAAGFEGRLHVDPLPTDVGGEHNPEAVRSLILSLHRAQRTAPRGFVGLKHFRERLLLPGTAAEHRRSLLDAALADGVIRTQTAIDQGTGAEVIVIVLAAEHPMVRDVLETAEGPLPELLDLGAVSLSATVVAAREAER